MSRMFPFITRTWNPIGVKCPHECVYCWAQGPKGIATRRRMKFYSGPPTLKVASDMEKMFPFKLGQFVFVEDMADLFAACVPDDMIRQVLERIATATPVGTRFLLLTKNPERYMQSGLFRSIPSSCTLGCTIESDRNYSEISKAPSQFNRLYWMTQLAEIERIRGVDPDNKPVHGLFISIEPILDFDLDGFANILCNWIKPLAVAVGYDNYDYHLPEPSLAKTLSLIDRLEKNGIIVIRKTLREAWKP